jgi:hypothetical protein
MWYVPIVRKTVPGRLPSLRATTNLVVFSSTGIDLKTCGPGVADAPLGFLAKPFTLATLNDPICRAIAARS